MDLRELLDSDLGAELTISISINQLKSFADYLLEQSQQKCTECFHNRRSQTSERFLTASELAKELKVSKTTLWNWDRKGITKPVWFGNLKRYKYGDIETSSSSKDGK